MQTRSKLRTTIVGGIALLAGGLGVPTAAGASADDGAADGAATIVAAADAAAGGSADASALGSFDVDVPLDPGAGIELDPHHGPAVSIGIPGSNTEDGVAALGNVVYDDVAPDTAVVARPTVEGVQALVQVVDHQDAAYPVVADPNTCGYVTCTSDFGKRGTKDISMSPVARPGYCLKIRYPRAFTPLTVVLVPQIYNDKKYCK